MGENIQPNNLSAIDDRLLQVKCIQTKLYIVVGITKHRFFLVHM